MRSSKINETLTKAHELYMIARENNMRRRDRIMLCVINVNVM